MEGLTGADYSKKLISGTRFALHKMKKQFFIKRKAMKKLVYTTILALLLTGAGAMRAQERPDEYLGLPGDNLNLYAVMKLFQESETLEGFERKLNEENARVNNLDLNGDNLVDYITVSDYVDGNVHTIVLRVPLSRKENQDVAVFTVEQLRNGEVRIQLIGDEALYGKNYIIEPTYAETPNPGYRGRNEKTVVVTTTYYDVAAWPVISFIYHPAYVVWRSSWYWGFYPVYWNPWHPCYWHSYYGYHYNWYPHYYHHFHHTHHHYHEAYHNHYYHHTRTHSYTVDRGIREGRYQATYSRPETRREGEALYARTQSARGTRTQANATTHVQGRRTTFNQEQHARTATPRNETARRTPESNSGVNRRVVTSGQNVAPAKRTNTEAGTRSYSSVNTTRRPSVDSRPSSPSVGRTPAQKGYHELASDTRRPTPEAISRTVAKPEITRPTSNQRSPSPVVNHRNTSGPSSTVHKQTNARPSHGASPAPRTVNTNSRQGSRPEAPAQRNSTAGGQERKSTSRR
jgi:hypothetical protein